MEDLNKNGAAPAKNATPRELSDSSKYGIEGAHLSTLGYAATVYAKRFGFAVFPCVPRGKSPLTDHGCKDATQSPEKIADWWSRFPAANVAIACGAVSGGLLVLDIDGDEGQESLRTLERSHGELPRTPQVVTGNGVQYYFRAQNAFENRVRVLPGIDIRSDRGYVIAPPSIHPNGKTYHWEINARLEDVEIQPLPLWLAELLRQGKSPENERNAVSDWRALAANGVKEGSRNQAVAKFAGSLLGRRVDVFVALELLQSWNQCRNQPPLDPDEVLQIVDSIANIEARRRESEVPRG